MQHWLMFVLLLIVTMISSMSQPIQAATIPFEVHTPYQVGVQVRAGGSGSGHGSYYGEAPYHDAESNYCIDFNAPNNNGYPIVAIADGIVVADRDSGNKGYGTAFAFDVAIKHTEGYYSLYMHLRSNNVSLGQQVRAGQVIGTEGATGTESSHLHFCLFAANGQSVKPTPMDGQALEDDKDSMTTGRNIGYVFTSKNSEISTQAYNAITAKADELWGKRPYGGNACENGLICHERDNGNMHWYGNVNNSYIIEDWDDGIWGWTAITYNNRGDNNGKAFVLRHGFWEVYRNANGPDVFGPPMADELDITRLHEYTPYDSHCGSDYSGCINRFCGDTGTYKSMQRFEFATMCWNSKAWKVCLGDTADAGGEYLPYCYELEYHTQSTGDITDNPYSEDLLDYVAADWMATTSSPWIAYSELNHNIWVYYLDKEGELYEFSYNGIDWSGFNLSAATNMPVGSITSSPMMVVNEATGHSYVSYVGTDSRIKVLDTDGYSWNGFDLFDQAKTSYADVNSSPWMYVNPVTNYTHVTYTGSNQRLYEFTHNGSTWTAQDISNLVKHDYIQPGTSPSARVNPYTGDRYIGFTSVTGAAYVVKFTHATQSWSVMNLLTISGMPTANLTTSPYLYMDEGTGILYGLVISYDGRIVRVAYNGTSWSQLDLSNYVLVNVANSYTRAIGYADPDTGKHYAQFVGQDGYLYQFIDHIGWFSGGRLATEHPVSSHTSPSAIVNHYTNVQYTVSTATDARLQLFWQESQ